MRLKDSWKELIQVYESVKAQKCYTYFQPISRSFGPEVEVGDKRLVMIGSNDYLGLTHDPRVLEAAAEAVRRWGSGPGGSRFLSGNMTLHEQLEQRLAAFVGKKRAVVHTTGFLTNLGCISCLVMPEDVILYDKENHASIFEGCRASGARVFYFTHNDAQEAGRRLADARKKNPDANIFLITEGVFSMSGEVAILPELAALKKQDPNLVIYLDDAHGLGVLGEQGRGTAMHCGVVAETDFIMGTFSKAMASIGGFIASDDVDALTYLKNSSKTLIFSAALPACNAATVLTCLDILESEPEHLQRLWSNTHKVRQGYKDIGLITGHTQSPIIPIYVGGEEKALRLSVDLFSNGVFALPAVYPAVPKGKAVIRTAYMSTHEPRHIEFVLDVFDKLARQYQIRESDLAGLGPETPQAEATASGAYFAP